MRRREGASSQGVFRPLRARSGHDAVDGGRRGHGRHVQRVRLRHDLLRRVGRRGHSGRCAVGLALRIPVRLRGVAAAQEAGADGDEHVSSSPLVRAVSPLAPGTIPCAATSGSSTSTMRTTRTAAACFCPANWDGGPSRAGAGRRASRTFADDIEYLMTKGLADDTGFALMGIDPDDGQDRAGSAASGGHRQTVRRSAALRPGRMRPSPNNCGNRAPNSRSWATSPPAGSSCRSITPSTGWKKAAGRRHVARDEQVRRRNRCGCASRRSWPPDPTMRPRI